MPCPIGRSSDMIAPDTCVCGAGDRGSDPVRPPCRPPQGERLGYEAVIHSRSTLTGCPSPFAGLRGCARIPPPVSHVII